MKKQSSPPTKLHDCRPVFTVTPLEVIEESVDRINVSGKLASFLEKCHFCKKRISPREDVFMDGKPYDYKDLEDDINIDNRKGSNLKNKASGSQLC
ncbi:hypothetical protein LWI28_015413 [Acer negundo]|uniref:FLZ-type domain-containing protein n=1 Tax=Acer negundo TaxID=4023 RepID=A0AAD5NK73_ACENE|nr:hypothetical protein LWI28_015413 [Acer negundo]